MKKNKEKKTDYELGLRTRQDIVNELNQPNYQEKVQMEREGISWYELREKLNIQVYK